MYNVEIHEINNVEIQPVPWKMRLEMVLEILNGGKILVNLSKSRKSRKSNLSVSHGTKSN